MGYSLNQKISAILTVYPNWESVKFMSESRVTAIYFSMLRSGKFDKHKKEKKKQEPRYEQMTIFDFI